MEVVRQYPSWSSRAIAEECKRQGFAASHPTVERVRKWHRYQPRREGADGYTRRLPKHKTSTATTATMRGVLEAADRLAKLLEAINVPSLPPADKRRITLAMKPVWAAL